MSNAERVFDEIASRRIVPVVTDVHPERIMRLADALVAGGLPIVEVTLRESGAVRALRAVAKRGDVLPIAGTVVNEAQVEEVVDAGAQMIVSPGFSKAVVKKAQERGVVCCPGVCTPTEIQAALESGVGVVKFFPAEAAGGAVTLKSLAAPFPAVRFLPTGGVNAENLGGYLRLPSVVACGGSWMVAPSLYADGDFGRVEDAVRDAVRVAGDIEKKGSK